MWAVLLQVCPRQTASASPGSLLESQMFWPRPHQIRIPEGGPQNPCFVCLWWCLGRQGLRRADTSFSTPWEVFCGSARNSYTDELVPGTVIVDPFQKHLYFSRSLGCWLYQFMVRGGFALTEDRLSDGWAVRGERRPARSTPWPWLAATAFCLPNFRAHFRPSVRVWMHLLKRNVWI